MYICTVAKSIKTKQHNNKIVIEHHSKTNIKNEETFNFNIDIIDKPFKFWTNNI